MNNDFYIGWMPSAPATLSKYLRNIAIALVIVVLAAGIILSLQQRKFSTASFEFGKRTEITGIYQQFPVPSLKVVSRQDALGNTSYLTIPLVGYGKSGAEGVIQYLEHQHGFSLDNRQVTFHGTLLYSDGKTLLQVDKHDNPMITWGDVAPSVARHDIKELGQVKLTGEVIDPKCYFGVMKPGHGKPHKDCAIRCIEGGMSPVFYVRDEKGVANYYLLLDKNGQKMNALLKDHIAEPLSLQARAVQYDDWIVLYVDAESIRPTGGLSWFKNQDGLISCGRQ